MRITSLKAAAVTPLQTTAKAFGNGAPPGSLQLSPQEQAEVQRLQRIDQEVRQHEQAHLAAAGAYARGGARFSYTTGPDGKRYATGGEVSIDTGSASTPEATVRKMEAVKRAAMAPANPSGQDREVYAQAAQAELRAQQELAKDQANGGQSDATLRSAYGATDASEPPGALFDHRA